MRLSLIHLSHCSSCVSAAPLCSADRFEGVQWTPAKNGSPVLNDALAYIECTVVSRMETADHWITYAHAVDGQVAKAEGRTASHHRKIGDYY